jgi:hypothetical protein
MQNNKFMIRRNAMEFDNEDNDSLSRTMELPIGKSLNHGKKRLSSNMGPSLHVPKLSQKLWYQVSQQAQQCMKMEFQGHPLPLWLYLLGGKIIGNRRKQ